MKKTIGIGLLAAAAIFGQSIDLSAWDKLAAKAKESSVVNLNSETLAMASSMLPDDKGDSKQLKDVVSKMKGIMIRSYEFAEKGMYTRQDVEAVRKQLGGPGWSKFMEVKDGDEQVEMWFHKGSDGSGGLTILAAEPRELTFVHINGPADLASLMKASKVLKNGNLNLNLDGGGGSSNKKRSGTSKEDDDDN
jgi:hypothetical protein